MTGLELRPRLPSEIVDAAIQLYRRHFPDLVTLSAIAFAPYILLQLVLTGGETSTETTFGVLAAMIALGWVFSSLADAAIVVGVSSSYLTGHADPGRALRQTLSRFSTVLLSVLAKWFIVGIGFMVSALVAAVASVLVIGATATAGLSPGARVLGGGVLLLLILLSLPIATYFFARYFAVPATVVLEGRGVGGGLRRSSELSHGSKLRVLAALGLPTIGLVVLQFVAQAVFRLLPGPRLFSFLIEQAAMIAIYPVLGVITTLLYYDVRIRKEGFDIEVMASELGETLAIPGRSPD